MSTTTKDLDTVARSIYAAITPVLGSKETLDNAKDLKTQASDAHVGTRETMLVKCAEISAKHKLSKADVTTVATRAAAMNNNKANEKTIQTLVSEIKNAAHPDVRAHVPELVDMINGAWKAEDEAFKTDKATPRPIAKLFKRRYHAITGVLKRAADGNMISTEEALINYAKANDPSLDPEKIHKRLAGLIADLQAFHHDFAHDDIGLAIDTLNRATAAQLAKVRRVDEIVEAVENAPAPAPKQPATTVGNKATPKVVVDTSMGVIDVDDLMNGIMGLKQAA
jgi:hypothetical protein